MYAVGQEKVVYEKDAELMVYNLKEGTLNGIVVEGILHDLRPELSFVEICCLALWRR